MPAQLHLSWTGDPATTICVTWLGAVPQPAARLGLRALGEDVWQERAARSQPSPGISGILHRAEVRGLVPDRAYELRVSADPGAGAEWSDLSRFRTAPAGPDACFDAVFFADTGIVGRADGSNDALPAVLEALANESPLFLLGGGDYAYANRDPRFAHVGDAVDAWFAQMEPLLARIPLMAQYGNHEVETGESFADWGPRFAHPPGEEASRSYSFEIGAAHFAAFYAPGRLPTERHLRWLDADLAAARARGVPWLVVYQHAPIFAHGSAHPARPELRAALAPILERHGVDLHLSAHDQSFERTAPLQGVGTPEFTASLDGVGSAGYAAGRGVVYAKIGPAGKESDRVGGFSRLADALPEFVVAHRDDGNHYGRLRVSARVLELTVMQVRSSGSVAAEGPITEVVDTLRLER